jgi:hypothetical protein
VVSVGPVGQGLPLHNPASAWQTVVVGKKAYLLLPPLHPGKGGGEGGAAAGSAPGSGSWLRPEEWFVDLLAKLFLRYLVIARSNL